MNIKNWLFRQLAEKKLIEDKYEYLTDAEKEAYDYRQEQLRRLEAGEDIDPPWVMNNSELSPWDLRHDYWLIEVWLPFWRKMNEQEREIYRKKWNMPDEWYLVVSRFWTDLDSD
jgi:hypothetical protein